MTLEDLNADEAQRMWELYVQDCQQKNIPPKPDSFTIWLEEAF